MLTLLLLKLFFLTNTIIIEVPPIIVEAEITKYTASINETDNDPTITASGKRISEMTAACPEYLEFGQRIRIDGKIWECSDRMNKRYREGNYFDLLAYNYEEAIAFGRQIKKVEIMR